MRCLPRCLAVALASLAVLACGDDRASAPTQPAVPSPSFDVATYPACDAQLANLITSDIKSFFAGAVQREALSRFSTVKSNCAKKRAQAVNDMVAYLDYFIQNYGAGAGDNDASKQQFAVTHIDRNFEYVGEPHPHLSTAVFTTGGTVKVCYPIPNDADLPCDVVTGDRLAGLRVNKGKPAGAASGAITRPALFSLFPLPDAARPNLSCRSDNLDLVPLCFEVSVNPVQTFSDPWVTVAVCTVEEAHEGFVGGTSGRARVAHPDPSATSSASAIKLAPYTADPFRLACTDTHATLAPTDGPGALGRFAIWRGLGRAASWALDAISPRSAFAAHGGTGGLLSSLSPVGAVDPLTFRGDFASYLDESQNPPAEVTLAPGDTVPDAAEKGTWADTVTAPGSILIQASLGDLNTQPVVLSQGGGACTNCGTLALHGTVSGGPAVRGIYEVSWRSVQSKPTAKEAPFFIRASNGAVLARLAYHSEMSDKVLRFNGKRLATAWTPNIAQSFCIIVDLGQKTTTLHINNRDPRTQPICSGLAQKTPSAQDPTTGTFTASDLAEVAAIFSGIDAGIMGWDAVRVQRRDDRLPH